MSSDDLRRAKLQWEQGIEHMLTRPRMFSASAEAFEDSFRTALNAWEVMDRAGGKKSGRSALTYVWRNVLKEAYDDHGNHFDGQVAAFHKIRTAPKEHDEFGKLGTADIAPYLRRVWERLRDPIERLAALGEDS